MLNNFWVSEQDLQRRDSGNDFFGYLKAFVYMPFSRVTDSKQGSYKVMSGRNDNIQTRNKTFTFTFRPARHPHHPWKTRKSAYFQGTSVISSCFWQKRPGTKLFLCQISENQEPTKVVSTISASTCLFLISIFQG